MAAPTMRFPVKVYYEDTDCIGVVYHANYLRFMERARTEYLAAMGNSVTRFAEQGLMFVVHNLKITFRAPARLGDELVVVSTPNPTSPYRLTFTQKIERADDARPIVSATVDIVCIDRSGSLCRLPDFLPK